MGILMDGLQQQINELNQVANRNGWTIVNEFVDSGISGAKGRDKRPQFDAMLNSAMKKEFDVIRKGKLFYKTIRI